MLCIWKLFLITYMSRLRLLNDVRFDGIFPMINEYCESASEFSLVHRIVYFLLAPEQNWLKIGMSQNILTVAGRIRHIAGREPFECHCIGLSTVREPVAHAAMRKWRIRSEWFHWCLRRKSTGLTFVIFAGFHETAMMPLSVLSNWQMS